MALRVEPDGTLAFHGPFMRIVAVDLTLHNESGMSGLAFKVKTTAPKSYCVRPNQGVLLPNESRSVQVLMQPLKDEPDENFKSKDKFLVQGVAVTLGEVDFAASPEFWQKAEATGKAAIQEKKLRVSLVAATPAAREGTQPQSTAEAPANPSSPAQQQQPSANSTSSQSPTRKNVPASEGATDKAKMQSENERQAPVAESVKMTVPSSSVQAPEEEKVQISPAVTAESKPPAIPAPTSLLGDRRLSNPLKQKENQLANNAVKELDAARRELADAQQKIKTLKESCDHYQTQLQSARSGSKQRKSGGDTLSNAPLGIPTTAAELHMLQENGFPLQLVLVIALVSFIMGVLLF